MTRRAHSMQKRLLALVLGAVAATWLVTVAVTWIDARHELDELLDGHLAQAAALLIARQDADMDGDESGIDSPELHRYAPRVAFQVYHAGSLALRSSNAPATPMIASRDSVPATGFATVRFGGETWRAFAVHGAERDVQVYVAESTESRTAILAAILRSVMWPAAIALPLLAAAIWGAVRLSVRPMRRLGNTLGERKPDALSPIDVDDIPSEMLPMVEALNHLFSRIATLMDSERRFTADAAHELRTPVAAIRANAQVALAEADDALRREALQRTLDGCDRVTRLVEQLLTLSRLEADAAPAMSSVELAEVARQAAGELAPAALAKGQSLEVRATSTCIVPGNETLLSVLMRNLVDNAVRYCPPAARIEVVIDSADDGCFTLAVEDSGPGLGDAELARLGERFFRVAGTGQAGSGLGWSIVRRIAGVHRFDIGVQRSQRLGGLAVRMSGRGVQSSETF